MVASFIHADTDYSDTSMYAIVAVDIVAMTAVALAPKQRPIMASVPTVM